jgi:quercetin dioxygenase-like cupin family protein
VTKIPLVMGIDGMKQQLQPGDSLDIPVNVRVENLEEIVKILVVTLFLNGIELPKELEIYL